MFKEKYARLEEYKNDLSDLESGIREYKERLEERNLKANKYAVQETFKEIISVVSFMVQVMLTLVYVELSLEKNEDFLRLNYIK